MVRIWKGWKMVDDAEVKEYLEEDGKYVERNDPVQASEKLHKAAERLGVLAKRSPYLNAEG